MAASALCSASRAASTPPSSPPWPRWRSRTTRWAWSCRATAPRRTPTTASSSRITFSAPWRPSIWDPCSTCSSETITTSCSDVPESPLALANLKPRLRMTTLYAFANQLDYRVLGTGNRSELAVGYFTKYGDGGVDLLPLGELTKTEVCALARELDVPERIVAQAALGRTLDRPDRRERDGPHLRGARRLPAHGRGVAGREGAGSTPWTRAARTSALSRASRPDPAAEGAARPPRPDASATT